MPITIKDINEWPVGYKSGGFILTVKMAKKFWEAPQPDGTLVGHKGKGRIQIQQAVLTDSTGDLLADVKISSEEHGNHDVLRAGHLIRVIVSEVQVAYNDRGKDPEPGKKLYIDQYEDYIMQEPHHGDSPWGPDDEAFAWTEARKEEVRGKVRHGVSCAVIQGCMSNPQSDGNLPLLEYNKASINAWVDFIITGE